MAELFIEIGTEEIPARFLSPAMDDLARLLGEELSAARLAHGKIVTMATPRRLVAAAAEVADRQPDQETVRLGPAVAAAFDKDGKPTKAAIGFARGQGVDVSRLERVTTEKGEYVAARLKHAGKPASVVLAGLLPRVILAIPFPKSMRWGSSEVRFARPIHRIVALLDGVVIPFAIGEIASGNQTVGHPFHSPAPFPVTGLADYLEKTRALGLTIDPEERRKKIAARIAEVAVSVGGRVVEDAALLEEVTFITESPHPILGSFDAKYLSLPRELVVTPMRAHQKYFPVEDATGELLPYFIGIADTKPRDPAVVAKGYAKVLRARLEDAKFFFEEDRKHTLDELAPRLSGMIFQKKLGSYRDKVERVKRIAEWLADEVGVDKALVDRAAELCKADLLSHVVGEFPELQGIMGSHYARLSGEPTAVAEAIREHYLPRFAGDGLPRAHTGAALAVADKMDSIAGCFGVGLAPTGSGDPYALRRAALGVIAIVQDRGWRTSLAALVSQAVQAARERYTEKEDQTRAAILDFFRGRLYNLHIGQGHPHEVVEAVLSAGFDDLCDLEGRLRAVGDLYRRPDFVPLAFSFKRVANILEGGDGEVDAAIFEAPEEGALLEAFQGVKGSIEKRRTSGDYAGILADLSTLKGPIDAFFDKVLVNCENPRMRKNRMALLSAIAGAFRGIADFRKFAV